MFNRFGFFGSSVKILLVPPGKLSVIRNGKRDFDMLPLEKWVKHETWESYKLFAVSTTCLMTWRPYHLQSEPLWYFLCQNWNKIQSCDILCQNRNNIQIRDVLVRSDCCIHLLGRQTGKRVIFFPLCYHVYIWWPISSALVYIWWSIA